MTDRDVDLLAEEYAEQWPGDTDNDAAILARAYLRVRGERERLRYLGWSVSSSGRPHSDRDGDCTCDYNPGTTEGPEEDCPHHGRPYAYWIERGDALQARAEAAEARLAAVAALADELSAEIEELRADLPPFGPSRVAQLYRAAGLSDARDRLRAALAPDAAASPGVEGCCCEHNGDAHDIAGCLDCPCHHGPPSPHYAPTPAAPTDEGAGPTLTEDERLELDQTDAEHDWPTETDDGLVMRCRCGATPSGHYLGQQVDEALWLWGHRRRERFAAVERILAARTAPTPAQVGEGYDDAQAWRDIYGGMFARWAECDAERLRLKDELRDAEMRLRLLAQDTAPAQVGEHPQSRMYGDRKAPHGEIVTRDLNGYSVYVCADCGQSVSSVGCPSKLSFQPDQPTFTTLLNDPTQQLDTDGIVARTVLPEQVGEHEQGEEAG